ncbi:hypothetical protein TSUD_140930 [Trifolium subterraneum]|uniref:Kinesin motor domain-containing protein n=1 Tax=Trifolium subterraneum TaxID=3900 RepID=A0A2Z6NI48_TRISU|nr:hypothetical protein TSUD_140930 [Trifolium subterraneum]
MPRSSSGIHHQRQNSDNFILDANYHGRWFQPSAFAQEFGTRSSSLRKNDDDRLFTSGLLDLHSFDTELLPEGQYFDDSEPIFPGNKLAPRSRGLAESNVLKSFAADKERANNVAKIKVAVRKRPLNKKEIAKKEEDIITIDSNSLTVHERKLKVDLTEYVEKHDFFFDAVLDEDVSNGEVYAETVEPIVPLIFQRTKATCFAYGQTGSGKTYTMQPLPLKASQDILRLMHHTYQNQGFQLYVSFFEIYGGKLFDLLNDRKKLLMREDGRQQVCIVGLQEYRVFEVETIKQFIEKGNATRSTGTTGANEESSRSHAILQLVIKRSADGIEGAEINKSLLALKECIRALDNDQGHIPFRGSKLTEVLRDSFVGNSRTVMISCISPSSGSCEHTLNTLRYADRVKSLSKGNSSRRDPLSSSNHRDSTVLPVIPHDNTFEDETTYVSSSERNQFGWSKQPEREPSPSNNVDRVSSGRFEGSLAPSVYSDQQRGQRGIQNGRAEKENDYLAPTYGQDRTRKTIKRVDNNQLSTVEDKRKTDSRAKHVNLSHVENTYSDPDDDFNALLKDEEDLVTAHRRQVEETVDIVREEMNLLFQADQPGNQLDDYISKLDTILSQKAAGIYQLQAQLAQFQRRLNEYNIFSSSGD